MTVSFKSILIPEEYRNLKNEETDPTIRTIIDPNSEPYFIARDIAIALGYDDPTQAIRNHCFNPITYQDYLNSLKILGLECQCNAPIEISSLQMQTKLIREPDVYALIFRSKLESAKKFQLWVYEEVLPSIRKTGQFSVNQGVNLPANIVSHLLTQMNVLTKTINNMQETIVPKALVYDLIVKQETTFSMEEAAKLLNNKFLNGNSNKLSNRILLSFLRNKGYISEKNIAYQRYINSGYFEYKFTKRNKNSIYEYDEVISSTQFTSKGLIWIVGPLKAAGLLPISHDYDNFKPVPVIDEKQYALNTSINYNLDLDSDHIRLENLGLNPNSQTYRLISNYI